MSVNAAALRYLKKHGRPVTVDGAAGFLEWGKPIDTKVGSVTIPGRRGLCSLPVATGARIDDGTDIYGVTEVTRAPDGTTLEAIRLDARATVYRDGPQKDTRSGVTRYSTAQVAAGVPCHAFAKAPNLQEGDGHWVHGQEVHLCFLTQAVQVGDEVIITGAPRLKCGIPTKPDGQPLWHVPCTVLSSTDQPGTEV